MELTKEPTMQVTYLCPFCGATKIRSIDASSGGLVCDACGRGTAEVPEAIVSGSVRRCLVCGDSELFLRKDFPQRLGVGIVVLGFVLSTLAWYGHQVFLTYGILFATALIDLALFLTMGTVLECYRCHAQYRGAGIQSGHANFDLETHERHRQAAIRTKR